MFINWLKQTINRSTLLHLISFPKEEEEGVKRTAKPQALATKSAHIN
jgi:hypothetical protein